MYRLGNNYALQIMLIMAVLADNLCLALDQTHLCVLQKRPDSSRGGALRWSLPYKEICLCKKVVAPHILSSCTIENIYRDDELWFADDPLTTPSNWKNMLDTFVKRTSFCDPIFTTCPGTQTTNTGAGQPTAMIVWQDPVATDNSGGSPTVTCIPASGNSFAIGKTPVTCTAVDGLGNSESCAWHVDVKDNEDPIFTTCPANQTSNTDARQPTAMIVWQDPVATDNSGDSPTVTCIPASGNAFAIGKTRVTCTAVDDYSNSESCVWHVEVKDNEDPVFTTCPANQTTNTDVRQPTAMIVWEDLVATDNSGDSPTVACIPASGNDFVIGKTRVTCTAVDDYSNSESCVWHVVVKDNEDPVFTTCPGNQTTNTDAGQPSAMIVWQDPVATDNSGDSPTVTCNPGSGNTFAIGQTRVTCTAVDGYGNSESCMWLVDVVDVEGPVLQPCPANQTRKTDFGPPTAMIVWQDPVATDNSGVNPTVTCYPPSGAQFDIGYTSVNCTAIDGFGNINSCSFNINVTDNCLHQLGMQDGRIENEQITASSTWRGLANFGPRMARLNNTVGEGAWCSWSKDINQWIQVNLRAVMWVAGVMIQGMMSGHGRWVTKFKVRYKLYGVDWMYVQTHDYLEDSEFEGSTDRDTVVTRLFPSPVQATMIRIQPITWLNHICMRFDLIGCEDPEWHLMFKVVSSIANTPIDSDGFDAHDPFQVWERQESLNEDTSEARQLNTKFKGHFKSSFVGDWETQFIDKVMVVLLDYTGVELITLVFNGTGSNSTDWFSKDRLLSSPYDDIYNDTQKYFSVGGHYSNDGVGRRQWIINRKYDGCSGDTGWMVISYDFTPDCDWERKDVSKPTFLYSLRRTYINWNSGIAVQPQPFGLENGIITDNQISASSHNNEFVRLPHNGRLNNNDFWAPASNSYATYHWIQVDFMDSVGITGIQTQGSLISDMWVKQLSIQTGNNENMLAPIMESGIDKIFTANIDRNTVVDIEFPMTIFARLLRVIPNVWELSPALRMEVLGYHTDVGEASIFAIFVHTDEN